MVPFTTIAYDAYTENSGAGDLSFSHTCTGTNRLILVGVWSDAADDVNSVTYAGASLTQITKGQVGATGEWVYFYYLANPASGANTVAVDFASTGGHARVVSYNGVNQTSPIGGFDDTTTSGVTAVTNNVTAAESTSWLVMMVRGTAGSGGSFSGSITTARSNPAGTSINIGDTNGDVGTTGAKTCTYTASSGSWGAVACEIKAYGVSALSTAYQRRSNLGLLGVS
jgi:hypothetical protein